MKNKGFSFVELILVLAVLSILMLIGVPTFGRMVERMKVKTDKVSASEIGNALVMRELSVPDEKKIEYYPVIKRYDELENVENYISKDYRPQSMKDGYFFVTALQVDNVKRILVGIGKKEMPVTNVAYNNSDEAGWVYIEAGEIGKFLVSNGNLLNEEIVMPENYKPEKESNKEEVAVSKLEVGDYVEYNPTKLSYSVTSGSYTSTFTPKQAKKWQVFSVSGNTIALISADSVGGLTLDGKEGYRDSVGLLNEIANAYVDNNFTTSGRALGSGAGSVEIIDEENDAITWEKTYREGKNGLPYKDLLHKDDKKILNDNPVLQINKDIWFASRQVIPSEEHTYFAVRYFSAINEEATHSLYISRKNETSESLGSKEFGVRPIVYLSTDV